MRFSLASFTALTTLVAAAAIAVAPAVTHADAKSFNFKADGGSKVTFTSDAPLETITGVTSNVSGSVSVDPDNLSKTTGKVVVPVASLNTGNDLRDEHLNAESWLDSAKFPNSTFEVKEVIGAKKLRANKEAKVKIKGDYTVHGVTKPVVATGTVRWVPFTKDLAGTPGIEGDVLMVNASFTTKLEDHNVSVPTIVRLKVSNEIKVDVTLRAIAAK